MDTYFLVLDFRIVPQARPREGGRLPDRYRDWKRQATLLLANQWPHQPLQQAAVAIEYWGPANADSDKLEGSLLDALVDAGVLKDDRLGNVPSLALEWVAKKPPGATIQLSA